MDDSLTNSVGLIAESLLPGREDRVRALFNAEGLRGPDVIWSPIEAELTNPLHRQFAEICRSRMKDDRLRDNALAVEDVGSLADWLMVIEVENEGDDFRYSHYGKVIAEFSGLDMTGRLTSEFQGGFKYLSLFFTGLYKAVVTTGQWVCSIHEPPQGIFVKSWQRLIVPAVDEGGRVTRFFALNVPENELRVGLELMVDPVFVVGADRSVIFANRAAHRMFNLPAKLERDASLRKLTGISLPTDHSPEQMLGRRDVIDSVALTSVGSIMERLVMTVSAAQHRNQAFYVVVMRALGT